MSKKIFIDYNRCIGCHICEIVCALSHEGVVNPMLSRIHVIREEWINMPIACLHCSRAPCIDACPTNSLYRDGNGVVLVDNKKCIGCGICLYACPFGIPRIDTTRGIMFKCDLCSDFMDSKGSPYCVLSCPTGALIFGDINEIAENKRMKKFVNEFIYSIKKCPSPKEVF